MARKPSLFALLKPEFWAVARQVKHRMPVPGPGPLKLAAIRGYLLAASPAALLVITGNSSGFHVVMTVPYHRLAEALGLPVRFLGGLLTAAVVYPKFPNTAQLSNVEFNFEHSSSMSTWPAVQQTQQQKAWRASNVVTPHQHCTEDVMQVAAVQNMEVTGSQALAMRWHV
jgi:hypothetical protein